MPLKNYIIRVTVLEIRTFFNKILCENQLTNSQSVLLYRKLIKLLQIQPIRYKRTLCVLPKYLLEKNFYVKSYFLSTYFFSKKLKK